MTIPFKCPHCGAQTNVDDQYAGTSGPCFQCGQTVTIPAADGMVAAAVDRRDPYSIGPPAAGKSKSLYWVIIVAVVGVPGLCCVIGTLVALLLPAVQAAREAARNATCRNNLRYIGLALHTYAEENDCFPPPYLADEDGTPMHSWRVLLLPYLEHQDLYDRYDFDEPWNGPNNSLLAAEMPGVFGCPSDVNTTGEETSYVAVVGPGMIFDPTKVVRFADILDGTTETIALVESSGRQGRGIPWMSPEDLSFDTLSPVINGMPSTSISSPHIHGVSVLMGDGAVFTLREDTPPEVVQAMLTVFGRESIDHNWLRD